MKIVRISTRIYPDYGGPAKQAFLMSRYLSNRNIDVINIACIPKDKPYIKKEKINDKFEVIYLPFHAPGVTSSLFTLFWFFIKFFLFAIKELITIIRKEPVHLIHAHTPLPSGFVAYTIHKLFKIPYFYTLHGLDIPTPFLLHFDFKFSVKHSVKTFTVSHTLKHLLTRTFDLSNIVQLPNGIETSKYYRVSSQQEKNRVLTRLKLMDIIKRDDRIIAYVGYMILPQKVQGMIDFLLAFHDFFQNLDAKEQLAYKLLYIGDGEYYSRLERKIQELNLSDQVFLLGKRNDVDEILAVSDLLALTSYVEGFPNVLLEAMSSSVPCIGTNVGDIKSIIGSAGYIVTPGDINGIKQSLHDYFSLSNEEREKLRNKARSRVEKRFDIAAVGETLIDFYSLRE
jgi:glycosyltransferase involved in cell wall biosynthesis